MPQPNLNKETVNIAYLRFYYLLDSLIRDIEKADGSSLEFNARYKQICDAERKEKIHDKYTEAQRSRILALKSKVITLLAEKNQSEQKESAPTPAPLQFFKKSVANSEKVGASDLQSSSLNAY